MSRYRLSWEFIEMDEDGADLNLLAGNSVTIADADKDLSDCPLIKTAIGLVSMQMKEAILGPKTPSPSHSP